MTNIALSKLINEHGGPEILDVIMKTKQTCLSSCTTAINENGINRELRFEH
jgi:hypothetical protein